MWVSCCPLCVPVLNLVLMLKWAYAARGNESRRSLARAGLILTGVCIGASIVVLAAVTLAVSMGLVSVGGVVLSMLRAGEKEHSEE